MSKVTCKHDSTNFNNNTQIPNFDALYCGYQRKEGETPSIRPNALAIAQGHKPLIPHKSNVILLNLLNLNKFLAISFRVLFMVGQTRIHIDMVEDLGNFLELEVVLEAEQTLEDGKKIACDLQNKLGISEGDLIDCAYLDMLLNK